MEALLRDLRFAGRALRRSPGFTTVAVVTLALGIGAATALFSVVHGVLLRPLPYPQAERIVQLWQLSEQGGQGSVSDPNFADWQEQSRSFAALAQFQTGMTSVVGGEEPVRQLSAYVSRDFFVAMGVQPLLGRAFVAEEQQAGGAPAVLVGHAFWQEQLGGTTDLSDRTLSFGDRVFNVVGVMPPGFDFPEGAALWVPRELLPVLPSRTAHNWRVVGRLREGVPLAQARRELSGISRELKRVHGDDTWMSDAAVVPLHEQLVGRVRPVLLALLGASALLLLVAVANVTNLLLARMTARGRELAVRVALGASRGRLVQQAIAESLVLTLAGGLLGVGLASVALRALLATEPGNLPRVEQIEISEWALAFALAVAVLAALGLGVVAAARAAGRDVRSGLVSGERGTSRGAPVRRLQDGLVATQVAITVVLLVGAGLLARSVQRLLATDLGFRAESVVAVNLVHSGIEGEPLALLHEEIVARLGAVPGVVEAGGTNRLPLMHGGSDGGFVVQQPGEEIADFETWGRLMQLPQRSGYARYRVATEGFFRALEIPLLRGRLFDPRDGYGAPHAALISESLARTRWPGEDPIGRLINFANMDGDFRPMTVVGIVGDVRDVAIDVEPQPTVYANARQRPRPTSDFTYVVRGSVGPAALSAAARRVAGELAPGAPPRILTIEEAVSRPLAPRRFTLVLLSAFGATALLLAGLGIYGVTSYAVGQRTREIGIRLALGAARERVLALVVRQGAVLAVLGAGIGLFAAYGLTRFIAHQLYGVSATDPVTFAGAGLFLVFVAIIASYLPARRATRVDPMIALREE